MSPDVEPAPREQDPRPRRIGTIEVVEVRATSFEVAMSRFLETSGSRPSWTIRNLERANQTFGGWIRGRIPIEEIPAIVLPFHVGGCERHSDLPQNIHLVPPSGLTVGDAHARLSAMRETYRRLAPYCSGRITRASEQALSAPGTFFLSAGPLLAGSTYRGLTAFQGRMTHLDGLHRLLGLMDAELPPDSIDAFVAVEPAAVES